MKIVFMGTPDYAAGALESLIKAGHQISAVVTQPDKAKGRSKQMQFTPVKECALKYDIPVLQPVKIKTPEAIEELKKFPADVYVVAAFGQILSEEILQIPQYGCINIHASLLPKYRGAAPIQWAIIDGEKETGVTIMQMDKGIDTGDILMQKKVTIQPDETGESLFDKLCVLGAEAIVEALPLLEAGKLIAVKQNEEESNYAKMLNKSLGKMDFEKPADVLERLVRGLNSWPSAYTYCNGKQLKIWESKVISTDRYEELPGEKIAKEDLLRVQCGTVVCVAKDFLCVKTGKDLLCITQVQLEGKKRMAVRDFLLGYVMKTGEILG